MIVWLGEMLLTKKKEIAFLVVVMAVIVFMA